MGLPPSPGGIDLHPSQLKVYTESCSPAKSGPWITALLDQNPDIAHFSLEVEMKDNAAVVDLPEEILKDPSRFGRLTLLVTSLETLRILERFTQP